MLRGLSRLSAPSECHKFLIKLLGFGHQPVLPVVRGTLRGLLSPEQTQAGSSSTQLNHTGRTVCSAAFSLHESALPRYCAATEMRRLVETGLGHPKPLFPTICDPHSSVVAQSEEFSPRPQDHAASPLQRSSWWLTFRRGDVKNREQPRAGGAPWRASRTPGTQETLISQHAAPLPLPDAAPLRHRHQPRPEKRSGSLASSPCTRKPLKGQGAAGGAASAAGEQREGWVQAEIR